jgi:hypothetical protein
MKHFKTIYVPLYTAWASIGFMRGINAYKYKVKDEKDEYFHTSSIIYGCYGLILYTNPPTAVLMLCKEMYRLEVNIRNMENEKKSGFYNYLV